MLNSVILGKKKTCIFRLRVKVVGLDFIISINQCFTLYMSKVEEGNREFIECL